MNNYECWTINGGTLEYFDETHTYLYNGIELPSITGITRIKFGNKYNGVPEKVLQRAAELGTNMHSAIEQYEKNGIDSELKELKNYKFLKKHYKWECLENEVPVVIFKDDVPICAGRLDMVIKLNDEIGLADLKRTASLDLEYLAYQLNLYAVGYEQCYKKEIHFLKGIHLREDVRKFKDIPLNHHIAWKLINEYIESEKKNAV